MLRASKDRLSAQGTKSYFVLPLWTCERQGDKSGGCCADWVQVLDPKEGPEFILGQNRTSECFHTAEW